jgi:hypothetical protein
MIILDIKTLFKCQRSIALPYSKRLEDTDNSLRYKYYIRGCNQVVLHVLHEE